MGVQRCEHLVHIVRHTDKALQFLGADLAIRHHHVQRIGQQAARVEQVRLAVIGIVQQREQAAQIGFPVPAERFRGSQMRRSAATVVITQRLIGAIDLGLHALDDIRQLLARDFLASVADRAAGRRQQPGTQRFQRAALFFEFPQTLDFLRERFGV